MRQSARVHQNRFTSADTFHLTLFQNAQQLCLHRERHIANLIQKQSAAIGLFKLADVAAAAPVKDPFSCPKSSDSISSAGIAAQLRVMKGPPSRTGLVQRACDQFLAGPGFALNRYAGFACRDALHLCQQPLHHWAGPDDLMLAEPPSKIAIFLFQVAQPQDIFDGDKKLFSIRNTCLVVH